jgi:hypothetical protein
MGHGVWDKAYNETNLLDWMLSVRKGSAPSLPSTPDAPAEKQNTDKPKGSKPPAKKPDKKPKTSPAKKPSSRNILPIVNAGPDLVLTLPQNSANIRGQATDRDGKIVSYLWQKTYGQNVAMGGATSPNVLISNLTRGVYIFRLRVRDNDGGIKDDYFKISVRDGQQKHEPEKPSAKPTNSSAAKSTKKNILPVANAGPDRVLTLPHNSVWVQSQAYDRDGRIVSYEWIKTYGQKVSIDYAHNPRVHLANMDQGVYIFRLRVKDNAGGVRDDYFKIKVKAP